MAFDPTMPRPEHAPAETKPTAAAYNPSTEERKAVKLAWDIFKKNKKKKDEYDGKWLDYYKMFRGRQWPDQRPSWRHSDVINLIFQALQSQIPLETDSRPKISYIPTEPSDTQFAEIMNQIAESDWERYNWLLTLTEVVHDKYFYGTGMSSLDWDPDAENGAGAIVYKSRDPFYCFPDPDSTDVNVEGNNFAYAEPKDLSWVKKKWPDKADFISPEAYDMAGGSKTDLEPLKTRSSIDQRMTLEGSNPLEWGKRDQALVLTVWCKSDEYDEITEPELDAQGAPIVGADGEPKNRYIQKLKYPNGRKIMCCGQVLLEDGAIEYDDGEVPFSRCQNYMLPREFWGISEVEQLEGPQKIFNKLVCFTLDVLTLMGNPIWIVDSTSGVDTDNLVNRAGDVIEKEPGSEVRREAGVQLQPYVISLIDKLVVWFDRISGSQDVSRGNNPGGVTAMGAIEALQEAAQTRTRQKLRLMDCYLKTVGQQYASRVMQYYDAPRIFRITNNDGAKKYFKFHVQTADKPDGTSVKVARVTPFVENAGVWSEGPPSEYELRGKLDVRASTGSGLPFAKAEKEQRLLKMFELGIIDEEEVLTGMDYPNAAIVLQRIKARKEAEAAAQQGPGGPPPQAA
jgi:hypothetical protein